MDEDNISGRLFWDWFKHRAEDARGGFLLLNEEQPDKFTHYNEM